MKVLAKDFKKYIRVGDIIKCEWWDARNGKDYYTLKVTSISHHVMGKLFREGFLANENKVYSFDNCNLPTNTQGYWIISKRTITNYPKQLLE